MWRWPLVVLVMFSLGCGLSPDGPDAATTEVAFSTATPDVGEPEPIGPDTAQHVDLVEDLYTPDAGGSPDVSTEDLVSDAGPSRAPVDAAVSVPDAGVGTGGSGGGVGHQSGDCAGRAWLAYAPAAAGTGQPAPVVVATHGLGDTYANFYQTVGASGWHAAAEAHGFVFVVPAHMNSNRPSFIHFSGAQFDGPGTGAEIEGVYGCLMNGVGAQWNLDPAKVYWIGFSEGAAAAELAALQLVR